MYGHKFRLGYSTAPIYTPAVYQLIDTQAAFPAEHVRETKRHRSATKSSNWSYTLLPPLLMRTSTAGKNACRAPASLYLGLRALLLWLLLVNKDCSVFLFSLCRSSETNSPRNQGPHNMHAFGPPTCPKPQRRGWYVEESATRVFFIEIDRRVYFQARVESLPGCA